VTGRLSQSFSVTAPLLTLWMIGGSRKSANKKNRKDSLFRKMLFRVEVRMLCEKNGKRDSDTERRIYYTDDVLPSSLITGNRSFTFVQDDALPIFLTTVTDPLHSLWMMPFALRHHDVFRSPSLVTCFPKIVIQNGGKNAVWERWETEQ